MGEILSDDLINTFQYHVILVGEHDVIWSSDNVLHLLYGTSV